MIKILYSEALEICEAAELAPYSFPAASTDVLSWNISDYDKLRMLAAAGVWSYTTLADLLIESDALADEAYYDNVGHLLYRIPNLELERTLEP